MLSSYSQVVILDVMSVGVCDCQTETGRLLEGTATNVPSYVVNTVKRSCTQKCPLRLLHVVVCFSIHTLPK